MQCDNVITFCYKFSLNIIIIITFWTVYVNIHINDKNKKFKNVFFFQISGTCINDVVVVVFVVVVVVVVGTISTVSMVTHTKILAHWTMHHHGVLTAPSSVKFQPFRRTVTLSYRYRSRLNGSLHGTNGTTSVHATGHTHKGMLFCGHRKCFTIHSVRRTNIVHNAYIVRAWRGLEL